jgi:hypothetical protein
MKRLLLGLASLGFALSVNAAVISIDVFQIISSGADLFPDAVEIRFFNPKPQGVGGRIHIVAEDVDALSPVGVGPESDSVLLNGIFLGFLTDQGSYTGGPVGDIFPGAGANPPFTFLSDSFFDVFVELLPGFNTLRIEIDPTSWWAEIETVTIRIPEPGTLLLLGLGLAVASMVLRRRR